MNTKGSMWRKWDLHLHTPQTKLSDNFQRIGEEEIWKTYCDKIENSDVAAFGITDYFSCENYFTFLKEFENYYPESSKIFFPNIEFRLDISVNQHAEEINIHIIFSNELSKNEIDDFLTNLKTNHSNLGGTKISCKNLQADQYISATVNHNTLISCLNESFGAEKPYLIIAAANNAGLRPISNSPRKLAITDEIDKICDGFFGGRQNVKYYLNSDRYETDEFANACPVICGCDAHSFDDIDNYLGKHVTRVNSEGKEEIFKDVTWIKADLTFEGLKQIKYEPNDRVRIQETNPLFDYQRPFFSEIKIIDNVSIFENQNLNFKPCNIPLNPSMVSIIGGRGEGKSILMDYFAKGFGYSHNQYLNSDNFIVDYSKSFDNEQLSYSLEYQHNLAFLYIKQNEVKDLALDAHKLGLEIRRMLNLDTIEDFATDLQDEINSELEKLNELKKWFEQTNEKGTQINNSDIVKRVIKRNQDLLSSITNESNREKLEKYTNNIKIVKQNELRIKKLLDLEKELNDFSYRINLFIEENNEEIPPIDFTNQKSKIEEIKAEVTKSTKKCESDNANIKEEFSEIYKGDLSSLLENADKYKRNIETLKSHLSTIEKKKLDYENQISTRNNLCDKMLLELNRQVELIDTSWSNLLAGKTEWTKEQKDIIKKILTDKSISIKGKIFFDSRVFYNKLRDCINGRYWRTKNKKGELENFFQINDHFSFAHFLKNRYKEIEENPDYYVFPDIENLFYDSKERLQYLYVQPEITFRGKKLNQISVGQRGTVYLCLKLATETFSTPILFDQPEDDLDNHFITAELIEIFRGLKKFRQVIIITHNANLVVNTDAEQVIIANNKNEELSYTSGALENPVIVKQVCQVLEGGKTAFENRRNKYQMTNK